MIAGERTTIYVGVGQTLRVVGSGVGSIVRLAVPVGAGEPYSPTAYTGTTATFGPYQTIALFAVNCTSGTIAPTVEGAPVVGYSEPYGKTVSTGRQTTLFVPKGATALFTGAGAIGAIVPVPLGQPIYFNGSDITLGPFDGLRTFRVYSTFGKITMNTAYFREGVSSGSVALRPAFNRTKQTFINTHFSDGVNTHGKYLSRHKVFGFAIEGGLQWYYANRCSEGVGFNAITVKARYQYPIGGAWVDCTFAGQPSVAIASNGADVPIDAIDTTIPAGAYIAIETYVQVASVGMKWPTLDNVSLSSANGEGTLLGTSDLTGQATTPTNVEEFYGPVGSRAMTTAPRAFAAITDSIGNGATDTLTADNIGFIQRTLSDTYPVLYCGTSGETAANWASSHSKRLALLDACGVTDATIAMGTNDIASGATYATVINALLQIAAYCGARRLGISVCTILTRSVSGVPSTGFTVGGIADQVNTYMATAPLVGKFVDTRPPFQTGTNVIRSGLTDDDLHPNAAGHAVIAGALNVAAFMVDTVPAIPVKPAFMATAIDFDAETLRATIADGAPVGSWADTSGAVTATEATARPLFKANATPAGGASLVTTTAGNQRLNAPAGAAVDDMFGDLGFYLMVWKANSTGGASAGRAWGKGLDRAGMSASGLTFAADYTTTDASVTNAQTMGAWQVSVGRFGPTTLPIRGAVNSFSITGGTVVAPVGSQVSNVGVALNLFNSGANDRAWDGEIARIVFARNWNSDQLAGAQAYLRAITGVPYM